MAACGCPAAVDTAAASDLPAQQWLVSVIRQVAETTQHCKIQKAVAHWTDIQGLDSVGISKAARSNRWTALMAEESTQEVRQHSHSTLADCRTGVCLKDEEESTGANQLSVKNSCDESSASIPKGCLPNILIALQQARGWCLHNDWLPIYVLIYTRCGARQDGCRCIWYIDISKTLLRYLSDDQFIACCG